jgi:ZIP family zinc transporter
MASGILIFLSLTDILTDAQEEFGSSEVVNPENSKTLSLVFFFLGIGVVHLIHLVVKHCKRSSNREVLLEPKSEQMGTNTPLMDVIQGHHLGDSALMIAGALAVHNFPEGVILFTTALTSPNLGIALAIGLIFHKFPEGIVISLPYYFSTQSHLKGFVLAFFGSTLFLFLGAIFAYLVFSIYWEPVVSGILLSLTSGILFFVSTTKIMPLAYRLERGEVVNKFLLVGVFVIAISEMLLSYAEGHDEK